MNIKQIFAKLFKPATYPLVIMLVRTCKAYMFAMWLFFWSVVTMASDQQLIAIEAAFKPHEIISAVAMGMIGDCLFMMWRHRHDARESDAAISAVAENHKH